MARNARGITSGGARMDEPGLNYKLADMLSNKYGLNAVGQADVGRGRRIDILVTMLEGDGRDIRVALEMEKHGTNKRSEAVKDAASRLVAGTACADLALAMVYPKSCQAGDDVAPDTKLEYLHVTKEDVKKYSRGSRHDYRLHAKQAKWGKMSIKEIPAFVSNLHKSAGRPEARVDDLKRRLESAVERLGDDEMKLLARSLKFNYDADGRTGLKKSRS